MDRFSSKEEVRYHPEAESQGRLARLDGWRLGENPFLHQSWLWKSWNAGWADADQDTLAPKGEIYGLDR